MVNTSPLQIDIGWSGIDGVGLRVTVNVNGDPEQLPEAPEVGVTM